MCILYNNNFGNENYILLLYITAEAPARVRSVAVALIKILYNVWVYKHRSRPPLNISIYKKKEKRKTIECREKNLLMCACVCGAVV